MNGHHYSEEVFFSEEDEGWIAIAPDLPGCSAWGATPQKAVEELEIAIQAWLQACQAVGNPIPVASQHRQFA